MQSTPLIDTKRLHGSPAPGVNGVLILNADDWGRSIETTDRIAECVRHGTVSSVSAMTFMRDSERAAALAEERGIDAGLHLNLTTALSASGVSGTLLEHHGRLRRYLCSHRAARMLFHPALVNSFKYVVSAQLDEFRRLYRVSPRRIDGHHHMHLCANVLCGGLLPLGTHVRRNFSFAAGEKSAINRLCRRAVDRILARRHALTDFFFSLVPFDPLHRLERIVSLARDYSVEVETHPGSPNEYQFLLGSDILRLTRSRPIANTYLIARNNYLLSPNDCSAGDSIRETQ